jgi:transmembrane sensor
MMPDQHEQELKMLFNQWITGDIDEPGIQRLAALADQQELTGAWQSLLASVPEEPYAAAEGIQHQAILDKVYQNLVATEPGLRKPATIRMRSWIKYAAAAALLLMVAGSYYFFSTNGKQSGNDQLSNNNTATQAGPSHKNKAILTLSNGEEIVLDASVNGKLAQQKGATVIKPADGQIIYQQQDSLPASQQTTEFNTVATPRGGEYTITLPDGTKVWLNAASSITFPTAFRGTDRTVTIQGEAFLDVAKNASQPFRVKVRDAIIDVLGTQFNVNAYHDEPVSRTTLLEGSIRLTKGAESKILKPGQQVIFRERDQTLTLAANADTEQVIAWKNGAFDFRNQDLESVMKQVSRWYNMDIAYEGRKPAVKILGMMGRDTDLNTLLKSLELTSGVRFKVVTSGSSSKPGTIIVQQ